MSKEKKCEYCDATTTSNREDFSDIGWYSVQFEGQRSRCACPKHKVELQDYMKDFLKNNGYIHKKSNLVFSK
jgi:hypothetical protein